MSHNHCLCALAVGLTLAAAALAKAQTAPIDCLRALQKEVADADAAYRAARAKQADPRKYDVEVARLYQAFRKKQQANFDAAVDIARANPRSDAGFACLEWLLTTYQAHYLPAARPALELLTQHHAANPKIGPGLAFLAYLPPREKDPIYGQTAALFEAVARTNPDRTARGQAAIGLARLALEKFRTAETLAQFDTERKAEAAEKAFEGIVKDFGDCRNLRGTAPTLGGEAKKYLYELRRLRVGKEAPDIMGEDIAGARLKLSDHRGKVVLLVFWASWCGPCMAEVPHEKELVEHFRSRPFVLIGVNGDEHRDAAKTAIQKRGMSWQSFWNGEKGAGGAIASAWNVRAWPTIYVIDAKGVIRYKNLRGKGLDDPLARLVAETEATRR